jgi:hypothetical protein
MVDEIVIITGSVALALGIDNKIKTDITANNLT